MKKKFTSYTDLTKKQLECLKEIYIQKKVESMSNKELKKFVLEIITHQIIDTIGKEEEIEAWEEMSDFFRDDFENIIEELKSKYVNEGDLNISATDPQKERIELLKSNNLEKEKEDMWDD